MDSSPKRTSVDERSVDRTHNEMKDSGSKTNGCFKCRKKVGLLGFKCRCQNIFCSRHRLPEQHDCLVDYKTLGKESLRKENPTVVAAKIEKI